MKKRIKVSQTEVLARAARDESVASIARDLKVRRDTVRRIVRRGRKTTLDPVFKRDP
jgi:hypothetical protein